MLKRFPKAKLNIIGPRRISIPPEYSSGVIYHGFLSKKEPTQKKRFKEILNESVVFVMPSLYEPFGIAPLEAMVYEIPCILTNAWAFPEMIKPGVNGELIECGNWRGVNRQDREFSREPRSSTRNGPHGKEARAGEIYLGKGRKQSYQGNFSGRFTYVRTVIFLVIDFPASRHHR